MLHINENDRIIMLKRMPLLFATVASIIPLIGLIDFSAYWVQSIALIVVYCSIFLIEVGLFVLRIEISDLELNVYGVMLISSFIITTVYMYDRYSTGTDTILDFITTMLGLAVGIVSMIFQIVVDRARQVIPLDPGTAHTEHPSLQAEV